MNATEIHKSMNTATQEVVITAAAHHLCADFLMHFQPASSFDLPYIQEKRAEQFQTDQKDEVSYDGNK